MLTAAPKGAAVFSVSVSPRARRTRELQPEFLSRSKGHGLIFQGLSVKHLLSQAHSGRSRGAGAGQHPRLSLPVSGIGGLSVVDGRRILRSRRPH